jgi:hypothetical protein
MRPARYSITAIRRFHMEQHSRVFTQGFRELYAAKHWLNAIVGDISGIIRGHELGLDDGIKLRSFELHEIMDHEFTPEEAKWRLDDDAIRMIARFRRGTWDEPREPIVTDIVHESALKKHKVVVPKGERPAGYVTVTELCKGTAVKPMIARGLLRASKYVKPDYGWAFAPNELPAVKRLIGVA